MDNQHKLIAGYRDLSQAEVDAMNMVKEMATKVGAMMDALALSKSLDQRWLAVGRTELQKGFMSVVRSIAQPTTF